LLERHGVLTREAVHAEGVPGGFSAVYEVLKAMEDAGKARRGYFVAGLGATQFALPGAEDRLRALRDASATPRTVVLAATDPASPWGAALAWPEAPHREAAGATPQRAAGARVVLRDGALIGWLGRSERDLLTFFSDDQALRDHEAMALAAALGALPDGVHRPTLLIERVDGVAVAASPFAGRLAATGFSPTSKGYFRRADARRGPE
jgi:ATP-dependent Lhr-like helicase